MREKIQKCKENTTNLQVLHDDIISYILHEKCLNLLLDN